MNNEKLHFSSTPRTIPHIKNKDMRKMVEQLCRSYDLCMKQGKKGVKLFDIKGRFVGCIHQTPSDVRALENVRHSIMGRLCPS